MAVYNEKGQEMPDNTPVSLPVGYSAPETLQEMIARMVKVYSINAARQELDTVEEADDFDVEEEEVPLSEHQMTQMQEEAPIMQRAKPPAQPAAPAAAPVVPVETK